MQALIKAMAVKMEPEPLRKADLPSDCGFVVFERPIVNLDVHGKKTSFNALSWGPAIMADPSKRSEYVAALERTHWEGPEADRLSLPQGLHVSFYTDMRDFTHDEYQRQWLAEEPDLRQRLAAEHFPRWSLLHIQAMPFDTTPPRNVVGEEAANERLAQMPAEEAAGREDRFFAHYGLLQAFWRLIQQRIAIPRARKPPRAQARRLQRMGSILPKEVQVVVLRRAESNGHQAESGESEPVNWTHRWLVGGHVRRQWYPSLGDHKQIWIAPFIKGPADRPLLIKDRIHHVKR